MSLSDFKNDKNKLANNLNNNFNYLRNLIIVIDFTENLNNNDYKPNRHHFLFQKLEYFIHNFFEYNYLSTITIITMKDYLATISSTCSSEPDKIIANLGKLTNPEGFSSIYNALNVIILVFYIIVMR